MIPALSFCVVYILMALLTPKVWSITASPGMRLVGVVGMHLAALIAAALAFLVFALLLGGSDEAGSGGLEGQMALAKAMARTMPAMILTVLISFLSSFVHWCRHHSDAYAVTSVEMSRTGHAYVRVSADPLRSELKLREEAEARLRQRTGIAERLQILSDEQTNLLNTPTPKGDPKQWSTQVLREEVARRDRLDQIAKLVSELERELASYSSHDSAGASQGASQSRQAESSDLKRRLAALEQWNRSQRD